ncbi:MAG: sulfatase [Bacteroidota bacterium]
MNQQSSKLVCHSFFVLCVALGLFGCTKEEAHVQKSPNILIAIADDASYLHMGEACSWIQTPAFDRVANQGLLFRNAFTPNAKCAPSRACLLTGRNSWQLEQAANMWAYFPETFTTYPEALKQNGYFVGFTGKPWGPGVAGKKDGKARELCGKRWNDLTLDAPTTHISATDYASNFIQFLENKPIDEPFCFWYGGYEPHRRYEYGSALKSGKKLSDIDTVPPFFPDNEVVRTDLLDYAYEIEYFDSHLAKMLDQLEQMGELENTIVIVTADNGMPFPHAKTDAFNFSNHIPLSIMWKNGIQSSGRKVDDYVSFIDIAPTLFDLAGIGDEEAVGVQAFAGKSLRPIFEQANRPQAFRNFVLIGKEKHGIGRAGDLGYPIRGIVKGNALYLHNYEPERWPVGPPQTGYSNVDGSPSKTEVLKARQSADGKHLWDMTFGKRPEEELYDLNKDPYCVNNVIDQAAYESLARQLKEEMEQALKQENDPRMFGKGDIFQNYEASNLTYKNAYHRIVVEKEALIPRWINASDIESDVVE